MAAMRTVRDLDGVLLVESNKLPTMLLVQYAATELKAQSAQSADYRMESYVRVGVLPQDLQQQIRDYVRRPIT